MLLVSLCRIYSSLLICFISFLYFCLVSKDKLPDNQTLISLKCFCLCFFCDDWCTGWLPQGCCVTEMWTIFKGNILYQRFRSGIRKLVFSLCTDISVLEKRDLQINFVIITVTNNTYNSILYFCVYRGIYFCPYIITCVYIFSKYTVKVKHRRRLFGADIQFSFWSPR